MRGARPAATRLDRLFLEQRRPDYADTEFRSEGFHVDVTATCYQRQYRFDAAGPARYNHPKRRIRRVPPGMRDVPR